MNIRLRHPIIAAVMLATTASCSLCRYVPNDSYLLEKVEVVNVDDPKERRSDLLNLSAQTPNSRWFGIARIPLRIYSMSGSRHPEHIFNRMLRNAGEAPVVYDELLALASGKDMQLSLVNSGYLNALVEPVADPVTAKKMKLKYNVRPGRLYVIDTVRTVVPDSALAAILESDRENTTLVPGMPLDCELLDSERQRIVDLVHKNGYFAFSRDNVSFVADTAAMDNHVGLTMLVQGPEISKKFTVERVNYFLSNEAVRTSDLLLHSDSMNCNGFTLYYPHGDALPLLKPDVIARHSYLRQGQLYHSDSIAFTRQSLSRLGLLKYSNISFRETSADGGGLVADVSMQTRPKHSFGFEVEGTNTAGDLGAAASASYVDRNLFRGSEQFTLKIRGAYESISNLPGYSGNTYLEYGAEASMDFPEFLIPLMSQERQRKIQATTQFSLKVNAQQRPEFQKTIFSAGWSYRWGDTWSTTHRLDVIDLNYLVVPWISSHFQKEYLDPITSGKSILKYNYEDLLITKAGYTFYHTNSASQTSANPFRYTIRAGIETSGNMFNLLERPLNLKRNDNGQSMVMDIAFAQYVKHDFSFTANWRTSTFDNLLFHLEWGVAIPYGNSSSLPFEKRYFAGGANGVRGWAVRALGPGTYGGGDNTIDYIRQSGDIKLGASLEYRSRLFWKFNGAVFADAGNIWTIRDYTEQPGGMFDFGSFYRQIAASYGLGLRLDLNFIVVRMDAGMKAYNPAGKTQYDRLPLTHPDFGRDLAFHLAVGYPF
ncbi:MAG: BamA/TamA family outer membrane protein [Bacteroidaceae bacterium]|nr:BamA/TamA family outer membrane protein [Bacteroidaceae bacterium]